MGWEWIEGDAENTNGDVTLLRTEAMEHGEISLRNRVTSPFDDPDPDLPSNGERGTENGEPPNKKARG